MVIERVSNKKGDKKCTKWSRSGISEQKLQQLKRNIQILLLSVLEQFPCSSDKSIRAVFTIENRIFMKLQINTQEKMLFYLHSKSKAPITRSANVHLAQILCFAKTRGIAVCRVCYSV